jgi:hypothetical protein
VLATGSDASSRPVLLNFNQRSKRLDHLFAETRIQLDLRAAEPAGLDDGRRGRAGRDDGMTTCLAANAGWQHELRSEPDPEWAFYREGIYGVFARR